MRTRPHRRPLRTAVTALAITAVTAGCSLSANPTIDAKPGSLAAGISLKGARFTVGSKEFTEQVVLCHVTSLALQSVGAAVQEKCGLSGSDTTRTALTSGSIDMYWEYTGTAWVNYLKHTDPISDPAQQYQAVAQQDLTQHQVQWLAASPANNTYAIAVKAGTAKELGVSTLSDYARLTRSDPAKASLCAASEFLGRNDGLPGLERAYGFTVTPANLAEGAIYNAVANNNPCNFGEADTTDGRISGLGLTVLTDDRRFFPVYNPALTVRQSVYQANPELAKIVDPIAAALTTEELQQLNAAVDIRGQDPADVAQSWLQGKGFVGR
jgi:osmoprotectant transport system substrate-binding protein